MHIFSFPLQFQLGAFQVNAHLVFELLAFFIGFRYFLFLRKRQPDPIPDSNRVWILIGAAFGAFFFSRLLGSLENPVAFYHSTHPVLYFYANKTIVGALLGGLLCVELIKKRIGERQSSGDLFTYPLILAMIIGRIGCFSAGLSEATFGLPSNLPWAIDLGEGIPRHPVALYEIGFLLVLWGVLMKAEKNVSFHQGIRFQLFMIGYLAFRLMLDFLKPGFRFSFGLTSIQISCLLGLIYYYKTLFRLFFRFNALTNTHA